MIDTYSCQSVDVADFVSLNSVDVCVDSVSSDVSVLPDLIGRLGQQRGDD